MEKQLEMKEKASPSMINVLTILFKKKRKKKKKATRELKTLGIKRTSKCTS